MKVEADPRDLVRNVVVRDYRPMEDSVQIVRKKRSGKDAAFAVAFEDQDGVQRRGLVGICRHHGNRWRPSGGFMGSARVTGERDIWMTWGGWGPGDRHERAVAGGWVGDSTASVRPARRYRGGPPPPRRHRERCLPVHVEGRLQPAGRAHGVGRRWRARHPKRSDASRRLNQVSPRGDVLKCRDPLGHADERGTAACGERVTA
jgi:hypothetical protein